MEEKIIRDFTAKANVLCYAEGESEFKSAADSLLYYIDHNEFLSDLFSSYFTSSLDMSTVMRSDNVGWYQVILPVDDNDKCAFVLKFLRKVVKGEIQLDSLLYSIYNKNILEITI